jgi:predicted negative regulator of RcsB-dependent stress response
LISAIRQRQCVSHGQHRGFRDFRLAFRRFARKIAAFMQPQEAATDYLFKLWPWLEANAKRFAYGAVLIVIAIFVFSFYSYRQNKREVDAGEALTQAVVSGNGGQIADACLKVATDYSGTLAGQRALLQGAAALFSTGKYADAQVQFQKFLDTYPDNSFAPQAALGLASSLDALGKNDMALSAYQRAGDQSSDAYTKVAAKFAIARIDERQGKFPDAAKLYDDIVQAFPNSSIASEASMRAAELKAKSSSPAVSTPAAPAAAPAAPFNLIH